MTWMPHPDARRLTPAEAAALHAQLRMQQALRPPLSMPPVRPAMGEPLYNPNSGAETFLAVVLAIYVGTTIASYYLVRGMAPKKSANSYGAGAAAANLFFPIVGPVVVGLAAAGAEGKR